jgi:hypothetical protein
VLDGPQRVNEISDAIREAMAALKLSEAECRQLPSQEGRVVFDGLEARWVRKAGRRWWWEWLVEPRASFSPADSSGYTQIGSIVPDVVERVWFIAESDDPAFVVCDTSVENALRIVGECHGFEYVLADKSHAWVVGENHHNVIWDAGSAVVDRIEAAVQQ